MKYARSEYIGEAIAGLYKNLAIANRSRVMCAYNTLTASIVTPWPWNLG